MDRPRAYLRIGELGVFFCATEATKAVRSVVVARINPEKIVAVRVLDFGQETTDKPDVYVYRRASLEEIQFKRMPKTLEEAKAILRKEMSEEHIFSAYKSF